MIDGFGVHRAILFSVVFLSFQFCPSAHGQDEPAAGKAPCIQASSITLDNAKGADKSRTWTTETSTKDGLLSLTYCGVFKKGPTEVRRMASEELSELPTGFDPHRKYGAMVGETIQVKSLPLGFSQYKDMAFEIRTEAIPVMQYLTVRLPSVQSEEEFKKLTILYLDEGGLVPGALHWKGSYAQVNVLKSNFKTRTLSAVFDFTSVFHHKSYIGRIVVASFNQAEYDKEPLDLYIRSVVGPPNVKVGQTFTYSVTVYNGGGNPNPARDVVFNSSMNGGRFVSVSSNVGRCRRSVNSSPVVVCEFGTLAPMATAVVNITVKAEDNPMIDYYGKAFFITSNIVMSRKKDSTPENNSYESRSTVIRR